jgi:transcriptional regulator with XRE-family HTH domain
MVIFKKIALHRVWYRPHFHSIVGQVIEVTDYRERFANRVRSLREAAHLSIEAASEEGGVSPTFWGNVERAEQEPCLNIIFGFAKGLGISGATLIAFEDEGVHEELRGELNNVLDLLSADQLRLALDVSRLIYNYKPTAGSV